MTARRVLIVAITGLACLSAMWAVLTQPVLLQHSDAAALVVDPQRLKSHVEMLSQTFTPRDWKHIDNLNRAAAYIQMELREAGANVTDQTYLMQALNEYHGKTYHNVVATLGPNTKARIVVGAHYDAYMEYAAADDNASGIAALIETARALANQSLPLGVDLVAFSLEEPFAQGSKGNFRTSDGGSAVHAASLRASGAQVRMMFSLDSIGFFSDGKNSQDVPTLLLRPFYPSKGNYIMVVSNLENVFSARRVKIAMRRASPLPVYSISAPSFIEGIDYSDHFNYWRNGYPAVMITDTAFNRNKTYHTAGDTAERLDYMRLAMVVQGLCGAVLESAR